MAYLRDKWRIVGGLIGALPSQPRQNAHLGLPLKLMPEETTLLMEIGMHHPPLPRPIHCYSVCKFPTFQYYALKSSIKHIVKSWEWAWKQDLVCIWMWNTLSSGNIFITMCLTEYFRHFGTRGILTAHCEWRGCESIWGVPEARLWKPGVRLCNNTDFIHVRWHVPRSFHTS